MSGGEIVGEIAEQIQQYCCNPDGRIRAEDAICVAAAVAGEACLVAGANLDPDEHEFVPGQVFISTEVNRVLVGDVESWELFSPRSAFGILQAALPIIGASSKDMPALQTIAQQFAASINKSDTQSWGWVRLTVPESNRPRLMPLRAAFELRTKIRDLCDLRGIAREDRPLVCVGALARILRLTHEVMKPRIALLLAAETLVGMSKMFPMTARHLASAADRTKKCPMSSD